jgi:hypothetical protein
MSRAKIVKKTLQDNQLTQMFNQMLGNENGDPEIIATKQVNVLRCLSMISKVLSGFATSPFTKFEEYKVWCEEFRKMALDTDAVVALADYKRIKDNNQTKFLILICKELVMYSHFLTPPNLQDRWILSHPGLTFEPFAFSHMDIKHIWNNPEVGVKAREYCLHTISLLFTKCMELYKIVTSPDIDVKKFSQIIVDSIDKIKSIPELSRCSQAFTKIKESVSMLENNFGDYYKDMIQSENPNTIIESFIVDVSQGQNMNLTLMKQFRTIINFYKKQSAGKIKDPNIKDLFNKLSDKMDAIEKSTK